MTTRITLAILLTTWVVLIVGEMAAFWIARQSLLVIFDDSITTRAIRVLEERFDKAANEKPRVSGGDQYQIRGPDDHIVTQPREGVRAPEYTMIRKPAFETTEDGRRFRTLELRTHVRHEGKLAPVTITYSRPAEKFDWLLEHLSSMLLLISLACGLTTAWLALKLSRAALRPLHHTADVIARIDERQLGTRLNADDLPVELAPMARRLNEMLARLQHVFQQRKQFLADAAHELRTPTASLLTTMEVALRRPRDQAALLEALQNGLADARRLRKLVESLMEQARGEHAARPSAPEPTDISELLRECVQIITPLAREKELVLTHDIPDALTFSTERDRLRSIVLNLLSNAVEYNRAGGSIKLTCVRSDGQLSLKVTDTGRGIADDHIPHVFEPFYRGGNGRADDAEHLGLGLFLVRSHVQSMQGQCRIESKLGEGTTMHITLPEPASGAPGGAVMTSAAT